MTAEGRGQSTDQVEDDGEKSKQMDGMLTNGADDEAPHTALQSGAIDAIAPAHMSRTAALTSLHHSDSVTHWRSHPGPCA